MSSIISRLAGRAAKVLMLPMGRKRGRDDDAAAAAAAQASFGEHRHVCGHLPSVELCY